MNRVEDKIFESFCKSINVENIREYEGHHLQLQQQNSMEQERLETTVSKLQHQLSTGWFSSFKHKPIECTLTFSRQSVCRINFETEQFEGLIERQASVQSLSEKSLKNLDSVTTKKQQVQDEMQELVQEIAQLASRRDELVQAQSEKSAIVSETKKELSKVIKVLDATSRDISGLVGALFRLNLVWHKRT